MKRAIPLLTAVCLIGPAGAGVMVQYGTAGSTTSLAPSVVDPALTADNLVAGAGLTVQAFPTFNFIGWDPASGSFAEALAADDVWTWGFSVDSSAFDLTTMDIRLDRSGTGPDDFEIQAVVTPNGGSAGAPISLLTHDYADSDSGVNFLDVDLSAIPTLNTGDSIQFTLGAFNAETAAGTFDLELVSGTDYGIVINGNVAGALPTLSVEWFTGTAFEGAEGVANVLEGTVSRSGDKTNSLTVTITNPDPSEVTAPASVEILAGDADAIFTLDPVDDGDMDGAQIVTLEFSAAGYTSGTGDVTILDDDSATPDVVLNEALINTAGTDTEFFELYNNSGGTVDIQGWRIEAYVSDFGAPDYGSVSGSVTLASGTAIDLVPGGFYLIGDDAFNTAFGIVPDLQVPSIGTGNGSLTIVVFDAAGNVVYSALADDTDGAANVGGAEYVASLTRFAADIGFGPDGGLQPPGYRFVADGGGYAELLEFSPTPAASATPGATNALPAKLVLSIDPATFAEDAGVMAGIGTVTRRHADPSAPLTVTLTDDDLDDSEISIPASVMMAGGETTVTFDLDVLDDVIEDGLQGITVTASAGGYVDGTALITVGDDEATFPAVVINEVWADDDGSDGAEYLELFGPAGASLAGLSLIVVDGDTGGDSGSTNYRRVTYQIDFTTEVIPSDGLFVIGAGTTPNVDLAAPSNWLQNNSQTYALVPTSDIAFDAADTDELTQASVDAITASAVDTVAVFDGTAGDDSYFGAVVLGAPAWDLIARNGDGDGTWNTQSNSGHELGDPGDTLSSPGVTNVVLVVDSPNLRVTTIFVDTFGGHVALSVLGLETGKQYTMDETTDLGQSDPWASLGTFQIGDFNVNATGNPGEYQVFYADPQVGVVPAKQYRISLVP